MCVFVFAGDFLTFYKLVNHYEKPTANSWGIFFLYIIFANHRTSKSKDGISVNLGGAPVDQSQIGTRYPVDPKTQISENCCISL